MHHGHQFGAFDRVDGALAQRGQNVVFQGVLHLYLVLAIAQRGQLEFEPGAGHRLKDGRLGHCSRQRLRLTGRSVGLARVCQAHIWIAAIGARGLLDVALVVGPPALTARSCHAQIKTRRVCQFVALVPRLCSLDPP